MEGERGDLGDRTSGGVGFTSLTTMVGVSGGGGGSEVVGFGLAGCFSGAGTGGFASCGSSVSIGSSCGSPGTSSTFASTVAGLVSCCRGDTWIGMKNTIVVTSKQSASSSMTSLSLVEWL